MVLAAVLAAACGGTPAPSGSVSVKFVGNSSCPTNGATPYSPLPPDTNGPPVGQPVDEMPHTHVSPPTTVSYLHDPPTSGCHYSLDNVAPIKPGVYPAGKPIPPEYWVHNLEHGYIAVTYNCPTGCDSDLQALNRFYHALPPDPGGAVPYAKFIAIPDTTQKDRFDAVSWDWFLSIGATLDIAKVKAFYDNHVNQSPEGPAAG